LTTSAGITRTDFNSLDGLGSCFAQLARMTTNTMARDVFKDFKTLLNFIFSSKEN
jgi:hypothetical protein